MSPSNYTVIGLTTEQDLPFLAAAIEQFFNVIFQDRDSLYFGGQYFKAGVAPNEILLCRNLDLLSGGLAYEEASDCTVIIILNKTNRSGSEVARDLEATLNIPCRVISEKTLP